MFLNSEKTFKYLTAAIILFVVIEASQTINSLIFDRWNRFLMSLGEVKSEVMLMQAGVFALLILVCIIPMVLFFLYFFYTEEKATEEEGKQFLLAVSILSGLKKFYCLKCILVAMFTTCFFLIPAFLGVKIAFLLVKYIKANNLLKSS